MATHSIIFAWEIPWTEEPGCSPWGLKDSDTTEVTKQQRIPWTEEPGGLQSKGSQKSHE